MSSALVESIMTALTQEEIDAIGQLLSLRQEQEVTETISPVLTLRQQQFITGSSSDSDTTCSFVDDYTSEDEVETLSIEHKYCCSNHKQTTCGDERCKKVSRCHPECQGCPHIPENIAKKERLIEEKTKEKHEKALVLRQKRTEIYEKKLLDAATYKAKWNL
jgi:hypothetical protein